MEPTFSSLSSDQTNRTSFIISSLTNSAVLVLLLLVGTSAHTVFVQRNYVATTLIAPLVQPAPLPQIRSPRPLPEGNRSALPPSVSIHVDTPRLNAPRVLERPAQGKVDLNRIALPETLVPTLNSPGRDSRVILAPQPKAAMPSTSIVTGGMTTSGRTVSTARFGTTSGQERSGVQGAVFTAMMPSTNARTVTVTQGSVATALQVRQAAALPLPVQQAPAPVASAPILLVAPRPAYTEEARALRIQGDVVLRLRVRRDGSASVVSIVRGLGHGLDEAACHAIEHYQFKPALKADEPVEQIITVTITFQLV